MAKLIKMKAPPGYGGTVGVGGVQYKVIDGYVELMDTEAAKLKPLGFFDPKFPPAPPKPSEKVSIPRNILNQCLKNLGVVTATQLTDDQLVQALVDTCSHQAERFAFEIDQARNNAIPLDQTTAFVKQKIVRER